MWSWLLTQALNLDFSSQTRMSRTPDADIYHLSDGRVRPALVGRLEPPINSAPPMPGLTQPLPAVLAAVSWPSQEPPADSQPCLLPLGRQVIWAPGIERAWGRGWDFFGHLGFGPARAYVWGTFKPGWENIKKKHKIYTTNK